MLPLDIDQQMTTHHVRCIFIHPFVWNAINAFIHYFSLKKNDFSLKKNDFS